jgi:hypothetical protein
MCKLKFAPVNCAPSNARRRMRAVEAFQPVAIFPASQRKRLI